MTATATDPLQDVLSRLEGVRQTGDGQYEARCPAHDDRHPSLAVKRADDGRILMHCQSGCKFMAIVGAIGMTSRELSPNGQYRGNGQQHRPAGNGTARDWPALAARYEQGLDDARRDELAALLGVDSDALAALHVGWNGRDWTFLECDGDGTIIGIVRRTTEGKKLSMKGGKRGLTMPDGWRDKPRPDRDRSNGWRTLSATATR